MKKQHRISMAVAALLLGGLFILPIWSITLEAPQYPEGIGLNIYVNTIQGKQPQDLQNINGLNHYIGMQRIEPDSIPELTYMPFIIGAMMVTGLLIALWGNRRWVLVWFLTFGVLAVAGLVDFYLWEYDYGHNLNPHAAIKIPGMSYQPPLLGSKKLLNFNAISLPHIGFFFALVSMAVSALVWWKSGTDVSDESDVVGKARTQTHAEEVS